MLGANELDWRPRSTLYFLSVANATSDTSGSTPSYTSSGGVNNVFVIDMSNHTTGLPVIKMTYKGGKFRTLSVGDGETYMYMNVDRTNGSLYLALSTNDLFDWPRDNGKGPIMDRQSGMYVGSSSNNNNNIKLVSGSETVIYFSIDGS